MHGRMRAVESAPPRGVRGKAAQAAVRLISRPPISHFTPPGLCHPLRGTGEWKKILFEKRRF